MSKVTKDMLLSNGKLPAFTSIGGYTLVYYSSDYSTCWCAECATQSLTEDDIEDQATHVDVYYEGPSMMCDGCYKDIESSYGDPNECEQCHTTEKKVDLRLAGEARGKRLCLTCYRVHVPEDE